jgi:uncharacterized protein (TIGR02996 family)
MNVTLPRREAVRHQTVLPPASVVAELPLSPERKAFLAAICAEPLDDTPRLVNADWLEENGSSDLATGMGEAEYWAGVGFQILSHLERSAVGIRPAAHLTSATATPADELSEPAAPWPDPLDWDALAGLAGDVFLAIDPHTVADSVAILAQFLVAFGNVVGRNRYDRAEASRHSPNLFCVVVGQSSRARKGTSRQRALRVLVWSVLGDMIGRVRQRRTTDIGPEGKPGEHIVVSVKGSGTT